MRSKPDSHARPYTWLSGFVGTFLVTAGCLLLAIACSTPSPKVSTIPSSVGTAPPVAASAAPPVAATAPALARSVPVSIQIPAISVSAPLMELGQNSDGSLQTPPLANLNLAGWYKYSSAPGQKGPAVIAGHIDSTAGQAVFYRIRYLTNGERIDVTLANKQVAIFAVDGLQQTAKTSFPTNEVYGPTPGSTLRLITCGGTFDYATGHYLSNVIVYAHLVSSQTG